MTKLLSSLAVDSPLQYKAMITKLEKSLVRGLNKDIFVDLDIKFRANQKIKELKFNPLNLQAEELYYGLLAKAREDDLIIYKKLRYLSAKQVSLEANLVDGLLVLAKIISRKDQLYVIKTNFLKKVLSDNVPKKTLKELGFRSIKSVLRNENLVLVLAFSLMNEGLAWHKKYYQALSKLKITDLELKKPNIVKLDDRRYLNLLQAKFGLQSAPNFFLIELGAIILPTNLSNQYQPGKTLLQLVSLVNSLNLLISYSIYLKLIQISPNFGELYKNCLKDEPLTQLKELPISLSYSELQLLINNYCRQSKIDLSDYLKNSDFINLHSQEKIIAKIDSKLKFWFNTADLSIMLDGRYPISFNLEDVALNLYNQSLYKLHSFQAVKLNTKLKLFAEYLEDEIIAKLVRSFSDANNQQLSFVEEESAF